MNNLNSFRIRTYVGMLVCYAFVLGTACIIEISSLDEDGIGNLDTSNFDSSSCFNTNQISISSGNSTTSYTIEDLDGTIEGDEEIASGAVDTGLLAGADSNFIYGESYHGNSFNLLRSDTGQLYGSIINIQDGTVTKIGTDGDGEPFVQVYPSDSFPSEGEVDQSVDQNRNSTQSIIQPASEEDVRIAIIDILAVWTKESECRNANMGKNCKVNEHTKRAMRQTMRLALMEANIAFKNSGVYIRLRFVHTYRSKDYVEPERDPSFITPYNEAIEHLRNDDDGFLDEIHAKRELYGADLVTMFMGDLSSCGIAYPNASKDLAFSITNIQCAVGNLSFAHEMAHSLGMSHDRGDVNACNDQYGFNYGWRDPLGNFRTIMATSCKVGECDNHPGTNPEEGRFCRRIQRFSTPLETYLDTGLPLGTSGNDAVRFMNLNRFLVSNFHEPCGDDPNYTFQTNDGKSVKCDWIMQYSRGAAKRRKDYCSTSRIRYKCRESCGVCKGSCRDKRSFEFRNILSIGIQKPLYNKCDWFTDTSNFKTIKRRQDLFCRRSSSLPKSFVDKIREGCPLSCGRCKQKDSGLPMISR